MVTRNKIVTVSDIERTSKEFHDKVSELIHDLVDEASVQYDIGWKGWLVSEYAREGEEAQTFVDEQIRLTQLLNLVFKGWLVSEIAREEESSV